QTVVNQRWKAWCPKFLGLQNLPGGIGAEVGVYRRIPGHGRTASLSFLPPGLAALIHGAMAFFPDNSLWWPFPELNATVEFSLINPKTNESFCCAGPQTTYWLTKWMDDSSYSRYKRDQGSGRTPFFADQYILDYTINGKRYPRWLNGR